MNNKISIIIPAYNIESELPRTVESVLAQTWANLEIILVNDGSTDGTAAVVDAYAAKDSRVKAVHKENGGVTSARLRGVAEAMGKWIGFVDGDDYIEPDMYERLMTNALECNADISHCGYRMVFPNGRVDYYYNSGKKLHQSHEAGLRDLLEGRFVEPGLWNKLFRRELFEGLAQQMDPSIRINEDLLMNYYLFKVSCGAIYEDFCPYHYIVRRASACTEQLNEHQLLDPLRVIKAILVDADPFLFGAVLSRLTWQLIALATMESKANPELIRPIRASARKELRSRLGEILTADIGLKLRIMALWTAIWPASYGLVHRIYDKITGNDKKYDLG